MALLLCFTLALLLGPALTVRLLKVAVIGAGPAGLASLKNIVGQGHTAVLYEQGESIGGLWWYTDKTGNDDFDNPIHTPMYKGMRINGPFQAMEYPNHPYPPNTLPYPPHDEVLAYMQSYVDRFKLAKHIRFNHKVLTVNPTENGNNEWEVTVKNGKNKKFITETYDAVFVCSGIFSLPRMPSINGEGSFKGKILHSHDYRDAEKYRGSKVLIIGAGVSALDIIQQLSELKVDVTVSLRSDENGKKRALLHKLFGEDFPIRGAVAEIKPRTVCFQDRTEERFDVIICATGYTFNFPFLTNACGIEFDNNHVKPLYKQILNINHPTMAFIGLPLVAVHNQMYDLQARFALKFMSNEKPMPSKEVMEKDLRAKTKALRDEHIPEEKTHLLGREKHKEYYNDLAKTADIDNIDDFYINILDKALDVLFGDPAQHHKKKWAPRL